MRTPTLPRVGIWETVDFEISLRNNSPFVPPRRQSGVSGPDLLDRLPARTSAAGNRQGSECVEAAVAPRLWPGKYSATSAGCTYEKGEDDGDEADRETLRFALGPVAFCPDQQAVTRPGEYLPLHTSDF